MNIKFLGTKVSRLSLLVGESNETELEDEFRLSFNNAYSEEDETSFIVRFFITVCSKEEEFKLDLEYIAFFSSDEPITEEFKNSHFPTMNAPAIAYPFIRSLINTITVNANLNPVILPTVNFQELVRQHQKESQ
jgi:preprotein translocase subunit SecB